MVKKNNAQPFDLTVNYVDTNGNSHMIYNQKQFSVDNINTNLLTNPLFQNHYGSNGLKVNLNKGKINDVIITFNQSNRVPDVWRYVIEIDDTKNSSCLLIHDYSRCILKKYFQAESAYFDLDCIISPYCEENSLQSIVLILESPHKDEYNHFTFQPIAPAQGTTGKNIEYYIESVIKKIMQKYYTAGKSCPFETNQKYKLIIANPVPYQASLHILNEKSVGLNRSLTDEVWENLFGTNEIQMDFLARLTNYNPSLIINACTQEKNKNIDTIKKRSMVSTLLHYNGIRNTVETFHPSTWNLHKSKNFGIDINPTFL